MVSCLTFKSLSHFEISSVHSVRVCSNFVDLHAAVQVSQQYLLKRLSFPHFMSCLPGQRLIDQRCQGLFPGYLYSVPLVCLSVLILVPHCFDDCGFVGPYL